MGYPASTSQPKETSSNYHISELDQKDSFQVVIMMIVLSGVCKPPAPRAVLTGHGYRERVLAGLNPLIWLVGSVRTL